MTIKWKSNKDPPNYGTSEITQGITPLLHLGGNDDKTILNLQTTQLRRPTTLRTSSTDRVPQFSQSTFQMISASLSLNSDIINSPTPATPGMEYTTTITGTIDTPRHTTETTDIGFNETEAHHPPETTPQTRNGGVRKEMWDNNHYYRRNRS